MEKTQSQKKAEMAAAIRKSNRIFDIISNKDPQAPYPRYPFRTPGEDKYGAISVIATCGDAYVVAKFNQSAYFELKKAYPKCHRHPVYDDELWHEHENTKEAEISIGELEMHLKRHDGREPYVPFINKLTYYNEPVRCVATKSQIRKLAACAKVAGVDAVRIWAIFQRQSSGCEYAEVVFSVGPYVIGLLMPIVPNL